MEKYNYVEAVKENVRSYIRDNMKILEYISRDEKEEIISNGVLTEYMNPLLVQANKKFADIENWTAEEHLCHNFDLLFKAVNVFGLDFEQTLTGQPAYADGIVRCYVVERAVSEVLDEYEDLLDTEE